MEDQLDKAAIARARLDARHHRISRLRTRVVAGTTTAFVLLAGTLAIGEAAAGSAQGASSTGRVSRTSTAAARSAPQMSGPVEQPETQVDPVTVPVTPVNPEPLVTQQS